MKRKLKLWNGRWVSNIRSQHVYAAAYSRADLIRMFSELGYTVSDGEIRIYWSPNCWGTPMDGIAPERGAWIQTGRDTPVRLVAKAAR